VAIVAMTSVSLLFCAGSFFKRTRLCVTYFDRLEVNLQNGATVYYEGIGVGKVVKIEIVRPATNTYVKVTMKISSEIGLPLDLRVETWGPLVVGPAHLKLVESSDDEEMSSCPYLDFDVPESPRLIQSKRSDMDICVKTLKDNMPKIVNNAYLLLTSLQDIDVLGLQSNLMTMMENVNTRLTDQRIDDALNSIGYVAMRSASIVSNMPEHDAVEAFQNMRSAASNLVVVSARINHMLDTNYLRRVSRNVDASTAQLPALVADMQRCISDVRVLARSLNIISTRLEHNPSDMVWGEPEPKSERLGEQK